MATPPSTDKNHILLLGGTGITGLLFLRLTLTTTSHKLTLYLRSPHKIPSDLSSHPSLTLITGPLDSTEGLQKAAACGADTLVSFAGPTMGARTGHPITTALQTLYPMLLAAGSLKRVLVLSTPSYSAPEDTRSLKWLAAIAYVRLRGGDAYAEIRGIAQATVELGDKLAWTVFRVPMLRGEKLDQSPGEVNAVYIGDERGRDGLNLDRGRLVGWVLREMERREWVGNLPALSDT